MGFTASEETRNPNSNFIGWMVNGFRVIIKESIKVAAKFLSYDVLAKFLYKALLVILRHLDNAVNITVYVFFEHALNFHGIPSG
jgi:hypothetical protein